MGPCRRSEAPGFRPFATELHGGALADVQVAGLSNSDALVAANALVAARALVAGDALVADFRRGSATLTRIFQSSGPSNKLFPGAMSMSSHYVRYPPTTPPLPIHHLSTSTTSVLPLPPQPFTAIHAAFPTPAPQPRGKHACCPAACRLF